MARRKLTKTQKAKNQRVYKAIRKAYDKVKDKAKIKVSYKGFKSRVLDNAKANNISVKEAIKIESRKQNFWSPEERSRENLLSALKEKHRGAYDELRNLSRDGGKFQSIKKNLVWKRGENGSKSGYILKAGNKQYFIDVSNSPEEVNIVEMY